MENNKSRRSI